MKILAALVVLSVTAGVKSVKQATTCRQPILCPCGNTGKQVKVCAEGDNPCRRWSKCKTCQDGLDGCLDCPKGAGGLFCSKAYISMTDRAKLSRQRRQYGYGNGGYGGYGNGGYGGYGNGGYGRYGNGDDDGYGNGDYGGYGGNQRQANNPYQNQRQGGGCPELNSPKLGSIRCMTSNQERTCVGRCLPGYSFEGHGDTEITLTCTSDYYTPMTEFPPCKSEGRCDLIVQGSGSFNCTTGMSGTRCDVICNGRYAGQYFCYPDEPWEPTLPNCVRPKDVQNVRQRCQCQNGGRCDNNGNCLCPSGWTGRLCERTVPQRSTCPDPGFVDNGFRTNPDETESTVRQSFGEGESVVYSCSSEEYALQGSSLLTCRSDGKWSSAVPKCISIKPSPQRGYPYCQDPGVDPNGSRNPTSAPSARGFPQGANLEYFCNSGYDLNGERSIFCLASGAWSFGGRPTCKAQARETDANYCQDPGLDPNGSRDPQSPPRPQGFPGGSRLEYFCNQGYDLEGNKMILCLASGKWSAQKPRCRQKPQPEVPSAVVYCSNPGSIENGRIVYYAPLNRRQGGRPQADLKDPEFPSGGSLIYSCDGGYALMGSDNLTCEQSGMWSAQVPECILEIGRLSDSSCDNPGPIPNGKVEYIPGLNKLRRRPPANDEEFVEYPEGSRLVYSCNNGYTLQGASEMTCQATGLWSAAPPTCITSSVTRMLYCVNPGPVLNGRIRNIATAARPRTGSSSLVSEDTPEYPEGSTLKYECEDGYALEGIEQLKCQSNGRWSALPPQCVADCGRTAAGTTRRILHGNKTFVGEWPWVVAIAVRENNIPRVICGGALLNPRTVLTAAHCLTEGEQYILYFGKHFRSTKLDDEQVQEATSERLIIHPDYNSVTMDSDIALIKFKPKVRFSVRVQPICLPSGKTTTLNLEIGRKGYVTGWGENEKQVDSDELMMANMPYQTKEECLDSFRKNAGFTPTFTQNMFCAGFREAEQSTCRGDSGSPLVFFDPLTERHTVEGIVSYTVEGQCGLPGIYSVYTKVSMFLPWIFRNMS